MLPDSGLGTTGPAVAPLLEVRGLFPYVATSENRQNYSLIEAQTNC